MADQFKPIQQMDTTPPVDVNAKAIERLKESMAPKVRRRNRQILSCLSCRRRKLKCDKQQPACANCRNTGQECTFLAPALDTMSQKKLNEIKERMGTIERTLQDDVLRQKSENRRKLNRNESQDLPGEQSDSDDDQDQLIPDDEKGLEATPLAVVDAVYDDNDEADDDILDLGFSVGKFRMNERLGGLYRPKLREEMVFALVRDNKRGTEPEAPLQDDGTEFLLPGPDFVTPGTAIMFGDSGSGRSFIHFLPTKEALDVLVHKYKERYHLLARVVHWPTFESQYQSFWVTIMTGIEPPASLQGLVFAVAFAAVTTMPHSEVEDIFQQSYRQVLLNFHRATEVALSKANILRTTKFEALQALLIYLIPQCRSEVSRAHSVLCGAAIRLGETFALHRDPVTAFAHSPIDAHVRRLAWFQLCFLDFRTAEAQGPRPQIRREDYDTKLPWNLDDADLVQLQPGPNQPVVDLKEKVGQWTDTTLSKIRFECCEMHRVVWYDRIRLDKQKITLTHVLSKIERFRSAMAEKYDWLDESIPIQAYAKRVLSLLSYRMHIMILHKYHNATSTRIPDRLRQIILSSGTSLCESAVELDLDERFECFRHYNPALQQWHTAFLLLSEIFMFPNRKEADRIWACLDHVFQPDLSLSRVQKARSILAAVRDRAGVYRDVRKLREPVSMRNRLSTSLPARARIRGPDMIRPESEVTPITVAVPDPNQGTQQPTTYTDHTVQQAITSSSAQLPPQREATIAYDSLQFDSPYTLFAAAPDSTQRLASLSPPGLDGPSPSSSSQVTESWPPSVSAVQQATFRYAGSNPSPFRGSVSASPPNPPLPLALGANPLFGNSAQGLVSGQYLPELVQPSAEFQAGSTNPTQDSYFGQVNPQTASTTYPANTTNGTFEPTTTTTTLPGWTTVAQQGPTLRAMSDIPMLDLDWDEWNAIFPLSVNNGELDIPGHDHRTQSL